MTAQSAHWIATARGLRRAGFGASGPQIDAVAAGDWSAYLDGALGSDPDADPGAQATPLPAFDTPRRPGKTATKAARQQYATQLSAQMAELSGWWLRRMAAVARPDSREADPGVAQPLRHVGREGPRAAAYMAAQNQKLRTLKLGDFRTLAYAMLTDAAMLRWLDGQTNTAKAANENLSREFMELFALGHGNGYTETDVREGARALTGWVIGADGTTSLAPQATRPRRQDRAGRRAATSTPPDSATPFSLNRSRPPYLATRLWTQLAGDDPPSDAALGRLVGAYGPRRDLKALTKAVLTDPEFPGARATVVTAPAEWLVGAGARAAGRRSTPTPSGRLVDRALHRAGPAAVLPARRRRLATRAGVAVHRRRRHPAAGSRRAGESR